MRNRLRFISPRQRVRSKYVVCSYKKTELLQGRETWLPRRLYISPRSTTTATSLTYFSNSTSRKIVGLIPHLYHFNVTFLVLQTKKNETKEAPHRYWRRSSLEMLTARSFYSNEGRTWAQLIKRTKTCCMSQRWKTTQTRWRWGLNVLGNSL